MILIADSGSTKCHWILCDQKGSILKEEKTIGLNPYFIDSKTIIYNLEKSSLKEHKESVNKIFFYGAGCSSKEKNKIIYKALKDVFKKTEIEVKHDLEASCYALYKGKPNITCILGTGSNSCFFNGETIKQKNPSLGFLLGDEASGNFFGKKILNYYFNNIFSNDLKLKLESEFITDLKVINQNIYNNNKANVFLAGYFPFIIKNRNHPIINDIIKIALEKFFHLHIKCFDDYKDLEINFSGSVAYFLKKEIAVFLNIKKCTLGEIIQNPIKNLVKYHFTHNKKT